jgi:hypothetical protein
MQIEFTTDGTTISQVRIPDPQFPVLPECTVVHRERNPPLLTLQADSKEREWKTIYYSEESFVHAVFPPDRR